MKITYFGTTMLMFDDGADQVMFDCHVTRPSIPAYLFGSLRTDIALADDIIKRHEMTRLRAIFISHSHHDHVMDAPYFARKCGADLYGSVSALNVGRGGMLPENQLHLFGKTDRVGAFEVTAIHSLHSKPTIFNNDLGQTIDAPLSQPAKGRDYKEGGSYDFIVRHGNQTYVIRPSFNYIEGQLTGSLPTCSSSAYPASPKPTAPRAATSSKRPSTRSGQSSSSPFTGIISSPR